MYCMNCGVQLPETAQFCLQCGTPQGEIAPFPISKPEQWEYCEIVLVRPLPFVKAHHFVARVTGPNGTREVAREGAGKDGKPGIIARSSINRMAKKLTKQGWEPQPSGSEWYNLRFRKRWGD